MLKRQQDLRCTEINLQMWIHHTQHTHSQDIHSLTHSSNTYAKWALERATWTANEMAIHLLPLQYLWQANNYAASVWVWAVCICVYMYYMLVLSVCVCVYLHNVTQLHLKAHKTSAAFQLENKPQIKCQATRKQFNPRFTFPLWQGGI